MTAPSALPVVLQEKRNLQRKLKDAFQNEDFDTYFKFRELDNSVEQFISTFNKVCYLEFISEKRAKQIIEVIYPGTAEYKKSLNWCGYLALLIKGYRFINITKMTENIAAGDFPIFNDMLNKYNLRTNNYPLINLVEPEDYKLDYEFKSGEFELVITPRGTSRRTGGVGTFEDDFSDFPHFLFNSFDFHILDQITYREYLWFKENKIQFQGYNIVLLLLNPEILIFNDYVNRNILSDNEINTLFYERNTDYNKFKIAYNLSDPFQLSYNPKYSKNLYSMFIRFSKENNIPIENIFEINKSDGSFNENIFNNYELTKFLLDNKIITLEGKKRFVDLTAWSENDTPLKLIIYDDYIPAINSIKRYVNFYRGSEQPLWSKAEAKLREHFKNNPKVLATLNED